MLIAGAMQQLETALVLRRGAGAGLSRRVAGQASPVPLSRDTLTPLHRLLYRNIVNIKAEIAGSSVAQPLLGAEGF